MTRASGQRQKEGLRLGDYEVERVLRPGQTFLTRDAAGRQVVLKRLSPDCLYEGGLHPSIRERLERIREVPHGRVANLYGVERVGGEVYLVWEFIDGTPLGEYLIAANARGKLPDLVEVGRDLAISIEGLNKTGLVHGALHGRNLIMTSRGIYMTHLSPLLYSDPLADADAVIHLLLDCLNRRYSPADMPLHQLLTRAAEEDYDLAKLGPLLICPPDSPLSPQSMRMGQRTRHHLRRRMLFSALGMLLLGAGAGFWVMASTGRISKQWWLQPAEEGKKWVKMLEGWAKRGVK